jgi:tetratricopeptide (TPR) repeat protein
MGTVFRAWDTTLRRDVAVKILRDRFPVGSGTAHRFLEEAQITGRLQHPGVPPVHQVGALADGRPFLAMKLIQGRTLDELLKERPDPAADRGRFVAVFEQVCQAVGYAHARGVIHRDLKPLNVMVGEFGEVQVMDWGLAKVMGRGDGSDAGRPVEQAASEAESTDPDRTTDWPGAPREPGTRAGSVLGTPAYMAPEQARGEVGRLDARADVFGLGGILCAILTGRPPFVGVESRPAQQLSAAGDLTDAFARLGDSGADPDLVALARRCLDPNPDVRPPDGKAVADAAAAYRTRVEEQLRQAETERAAAEARAAEQRRKRRWQLAATAVFGLLLAGAAGFAWWQDKQATRNDDAIESLIGRSEEALKNDEASTTEFAGAALAEADRRMVDRRGARFRDRAARCAADLSMLRELNDIDNFRTTPIGYKFADSKEVASRWRVAFTRYGIAPAETPAGEAAARVTGSLIRDRLLMALDLWLLYERSLRIREVLRAADPDPYRDAVRDAVATLDKSRMADLAGREMALEQPPAFAVAMGHLSAVPPERRRKILQAALRSRPSDFVLLMELGSSYPDDQREGASERVRWWQAAVALRPANPAARHHLAFALHDNGDLDEAIAACREDIKADPKYAPPHYSLARFLHDQGNVKGAMAEYKKAIELDPTIAFAHTNLGNLHADKGELTAAIAAYREAIRLDPKLVIAQTNLGVALEKHGNLGGAIAAYKKAIEVDPNYAPAHNNLGAVLEKQRDLRGAIAAYREAIRLDPKYAPPHYNLGIVFWKRGELDRAIASFKEAIRIDPTSAPAHTNLGTTLVGKKDVTGALASYQEAIRLDPNNAEAHGSLAFLLAVGPDGVRDGRQAVEHATRACELTGWNDPDFIHTLAAAHAEARDFDKAVEYQKRALSSPSYAKAIGRVGREQLDLYAQKKPYRDAALAAPPREPGPPPREAKN